MLAKVYRPVRNWRGETVGEPPLIGEYANVVVGGPAVSPLKNFQGTVETTGLLGFPTGCDVAQHDRVVIGSTVYQVTSDHLWDEPNVLTGNSPTYFWVETRSTS